MLKRIVLMALGAMLVVGMASPAFAQAKKRVLFLTKSQGFQHSVIARDRNNPDKPAWLEMILTEFGRWNGFEITTTKDASVFDDPATYDKYDVFMFYTTGDLTKNSADGGKGMSAQGKANFLKAIADGKGFVGIHSAPDTFHSAKKYPVRPENAEGVDPYIAMIGGEFMTHQSQQKATMKMVSPDFPGLQGLKSFTMVDEWYVNNNTAPDLHVILVQDTGTMGKNGRRENAYNRAPYPATWARMQGKGRVFYTSMGHREDVCANPVFLEVMLAGLNWASGRTQYDPKPNMAEVCPPDAPIPAPAQ